MRRHQALAEQGEPQVALFAEEEDAFRRTQQLISETCMTDVATSTGAMVATMDKFSGLTLESFTAESVQVAISLILDPGLWFQDPGQGRRILSERGTKKLTELHEESLMRLKIAAGGPTAGCNYRTHAGRTEPMCTVVGTLLPPPVRPASLDVVDSPSEVEGEDAAAHGDPAPAPAPMIVEEVWGAASLLRRLATFEATPSETALEVRVNDATGALYRIRTKPDESAAGLPLNVESSLAVAREWVGSHPSPWVRTWEISDDFEPVDESSPKESKASRPLLRLRKTDPPVGAVPSAQPDGMVRTRDSATVVVSPDDFREMLSA